MGPMMLRIVIISLIFTTLAAELISNASKNQTSKKTQASISHETKWLLTKIHGIAFVFAWFFFVPIAVGSARYFRDSLTQYTPMGLRLWYHTHRTFNLIAAALMIVGLATIFVAHEWRWLGPKVGGGSRNYSSTAYHTMFGLFSVLLAWIQPFNSLLRCGPRHRLRILFNWAHRSIGIISLLFATTAIYIACVYFYKHLTSTTSAIVFCSLCVGVIFVATLMLEFMAWRGRRDKQPLLDDPESEKHFESSTQVDYQYLVQGAIFAVATALLIAFCSALSAIIAQKD
ncbi:hypothetical protein QR680_015155 [Steinernema hermaphroditum]|uniref:Cytochrome b561 domain-containing protein n=1 Tax=Steinernema hermaphroditum TaxID=289476 RepID=A0AA39IBC1_9BILA|nr:hypothetical protein QR680_015155 [Steinernema hermaphroditum]